MNRNKKNILIGISILTIATLSAVLVGHKIYLPEISNSVYFNPQPTSTCEPNPYPPPVGCRPTATPYNPYPPPATETPTPTPTIVFKYIYLPLVIE
jgi:hypothetical protein